MARIMLVRHAKTQKGVGTIKGYLTSQGEMDAKILGQNLPDSMKNVPISYVGGSAHSRSVYTALLIALGAGADPQILPSREWLGSERIFFSMTSKERFNDALKTCNGNIMQATRSILSTGDISLIKDEMLKVVKEHGQLKGNIILGSHKPWLELLYESMIGREYNHNSPELSYLVVDVVNGEINIIETNLPQ